MKIINAIGLFFSQLASYYENRKYVKTLHLKGHEFVLEIGAYKGFLSNEILKGIQQGGAITCSDFEADYINDLKYVVRKYGNTNFIYGNIANINLGKEIYDVIIVSHGIQNVMELEQIHYIEALKKILKPDGSIYIRQVVSGEDSINSSNLRQIIRDAGLKELDYEFKKTKKITIYYGTFKKMENVSVLN